MSRRVLKALRIGLGAVIGATLGLAVDLSVAMMSVGDGPNAWDKPLAIIAFGGPIAIVVGAILGAVVRGRRSAAASEPLTGGSPATWRSYHPISWFVGLVASVLVGVGLVPIIMMLSFVAMYLGARVGLTYPVVSFLVAPAIIYSMVVVGRGVMRFVERKVRPRAPDAETSAVWLPD